LSKWDDTLQKDLEEKEQVERFLKQLESPFGFLDTMKEEAEEDEDDELETQSNIGGSKGRSPFELAMIQNEKKIKEREMQYSKTLDVVSNNIA
jgi:hypothetical protein